MRSLYKICLIGLITTLFTSCVEEIEFETAAIEDYLVVDARLTDEMKKHQVVLSRTYGINDSVGSNPVSNARVFIRVSDGSTLEFNEKAPGLYESSTEFQAEAGKTYKLNLETTSGEVYESEPEELLQSGELQDIMVERRFFENRDGVAITINSTAGVEAPAYYKYEYEETYKFESPYRYSTNLKYDQETGSFYEDWKEVDEQTCYNTEVSNELLLASTGNLESGNLDNFLVRFFDAGAPEISFRYSILVKQLAISERAYSYYSTLKELSTNNNLFSQVQPGFLAGNILAVNEEKDAIGFFTISSVSKKRIFFNFEDVHDFTDRRSYFATECSPGAPELVGPMADIVIDQLNDGSIKFIGPNLLPEPGEGPYVFINAPCVDCRFFGELDPPDFWIE